MPNLIIVRLHLDKPISGADFTNYLNGVTITAFDLSCGDPTIGTKVGDATYIAPPSTSTRIFQHINSFTLAPESVASAVIEVLLPGGYKDYVTADLRIEITRGTTTIVKKNFYYDVPIATVGAIPIPDNFPGLSPTSLYLKLPRPITPGLASVELSDDGSPPNFEALKDAVSAVIVADQQGSPAATLGKLTADQARHIAYEIIWGAQDPLPVPASNNVPTGWDDRGALYTLEVNDGSIVNQLEQNRRRNNEGLALISQQSFTLNFVLERKTNERCRPKILAV